MLFIKLNHNIVLILKIRSVRHRLAIKFNLRPSYCSYKHCTKIGSQNNNKIEHDFLFQGHYAKVKRCWLSKLTFVYYAYKQCTQVLKRVAHWNKSHWPHQTILRSNVFELNLPILPLNIVPKLEKDWLTGRKVIDRNIQLWRLAEVFLLSRPLWQGQRMLVFQQKLCKLLIGHTDRQTDKLIPEYTNTLRDVGGYKKQF